MSISNGLGILSFGAVSGWNGYCALDSLLETANIKAAVLQSQLANSSEITEQIYKTANEAAESLSRGDYYSGMFSAAIASATGVAAIYLACRKDE